MAFAVTFDGARVSDASTTTGWTADGVTPTLETDFFYQGTSSISATVKTSEAGFYFTSTTQNLGTGASALFKLLAANKDVLDGNGVILRIGQSISAYYQYNSVFTASTYPIAGGWQLVRIDPTAARWRSSTTGFPNLGSTTIWGLRADYSATAKSQNTALDAVDWIPAAKGLTGSGNTPGGSMADFVTADEGTAANRWGVVQTRGGINYINATLTIGSATATTFADSNQILVFPHHRISSGGCGVVWDVQHASTAITMTACVFSGRGDFFENVSTAPAQDTRPVYSISGTSGTLNLSASSFTTFRTISFNSSATASDCAFIAGRSVIGDGADLRRSEFTGSSTTADGRRVLSVSSITRTGSTAIATTSTPHNLEDGATITIAGANQTEYNGTFTVATSGANTGPSAFTYTVTGIPATPATGTITATTVDYSSLTWNVNTDPDGKLDSCSFTKGSTTTHAIEFGTSSPTTMTLRGISFSGYNASNSQGDSTLLFARTSGTVTVNLVGCTGNISFKSEGATIVFVVDPVTTSITTKDATSQANVQNARVILLAADATGPLPFQKSTTITRSGSTATASCTAHGLLTNDYAVIKGANQQEYNGVFQVTRIDDNSFSYTVSGTPVTPATGTITTTGAALYGLTNASGVVSTSRSYSTSQPVTGTARRATVADGTLYKPSPITGTISNTAGLSATVQLIRDE